MFIEQGIKEDNKFWKYIVGFVITLIGYIIGQLPLTVAVVYKSLKDGKGFPTDEKQMMTILDSNLTFFLMLLIFVFAIISLFLVVKYLHKQTILSITTARKKIDWNRILFSFSIWSIFTILSTYLSYYYYPEDFVWNFKPVPFAILAVITLLLIPIQTSCEEYIFRGYLMQGFGNLAKNRWLPLVLTSVIFGTMHIMNPEVNKMGYIVMIYYIGTGFLLGIMTLMDDGMELSLGFHAANNLIGALLITSDWGVFQTNSILKDISKPEAGAQIFIPVLIVYPILLFLFSKKYGWKNWKEKLTGNITELNNEIEIIGNE